MLFVEHENISEIMDKMRTDKYFLCSINPNINFTVSKKNGYKIFTVYLEEGDPFFEPEDLHGLRIYTVVNNKIKDCKTVAVPFFEIATEKEREFFKENMYPDFDDYKVYISNGYANILCYSQLLQNFEGPNAIGTTGILLVSDGMYSRRTDSLEKLLSIISPE